MKGESANVNRQGHSVKGASSTLGKTGNAAMPDPSGTGTKSGSKTWPGTGKS